MSTSVLLLLPASFIVMALVFLIAARGLTRASKWLGVIVLALAAPLFFWMGAFSEQFSAGICYSEAFHQVAGAVAQTDNPKALAQRIDALPLRGYETSCPEVEAAARSLSGAESR